METQTQGWRGGGAAAISEGYWLTAGSSPRCQDGGAPRIWMKQQQNGFASPSLSLLPPSPEDDRVRMAEGKKKNASACCERHCIIYTEEHKQSWTNCLKRKMWSLCIHRSIRLHTRAHSRTALSLSQQRGRLPSFSSLLMSLPAWFYIHIWRHWAHFRLGGSDDERIISNVQKLPSSVAIDLEIWQKKKKDLWLFWGRLIMRLGVYFKRIYFIIVWTFSTHLC